MSTPFFDFDSARSRLLCLTAAAVVSACGSAVAEGETDAASSSSSSSAGTTTPQPPGTTVPDPATTTPPDPGTTTGVDPSASTTDGADGSSSGGSDFITKNDAGVGATGFCIGFSAFGHLAMIHTADGQGTKTQCETTPAACGGDITGTWVIDEYCGLETFPNFFEDQCPASTMTVVGSEVSGSRTFAEDGTFTIDRSIVTDIDLQIDAQDCFGASCEQFADLISDEGLVTTCVEAAESGCDCDLQIVEPQDAMGTYETDGNGFTLTINGQESVSVDYCAANGELVIWEPLNDSTTYLDAACEVAEDCPRELGDIEDTWVCAMP